MQKIIEEAASSADGARITWQRSGTGPAVIVLPGATRAATHYRRLAQALADRFTMILVDRRGRGHSSPVPPSHTIANEIEDVAAVMHATGATQVFGHSSGAVIALEAARVLPISRLAVYEPPVAIATLLPLGWVPAFRAALDADRPARAMAILARGMQMPPTKLPVRVLAPMFWLMMRGSAGREMAALLRTFPSDLALGLSAGTDVSRYREVKCPTLLLGGARSPHYLHRALELVHEVLPGGRRVELASVGHNAPDGQAPDLVAAELVRFFTASDAAAPASEQAATR